MADAHLPPAPWGWECNGAAGSPMGSGFVYLFDVNGRKIGTVWGKPAEKVALANISTAAPDMLAALKNLDDEGLLQVLIDLDSSREEDEEPIAKKAVDLVRAAIAKAEGRAP